MTIPADRSASLPPASEPSATPDERWKDFDAEIARIEARVNRTVFGSHGAMMDSYPGDAGGDLMTVIGIVKRLRAAVALPGAPRDETLRAAVKRVSQPRDGFVLIAGREVYYRDVLAAFDAPAGAPAEEGGGKVT